MRLLGPVLFGSAAALLVWRFWRAPKWVSFPGHGLGGLAVILAASGLTALDVRSIKLYLTPIAWTGYILAVDGAVWSIRGRSWLRSEPGRFAWAALLSIPLWLVFEAYNLRLKNWVYVGLPERGWMRILGYVWSFATIWPAVLVTAEFLLATRVGTEHTRWRIKWPPRALVGIGAAMLAAPILAPATWGAYLFGMVWLGFVLLLDPLNAKAARPSLLADSARLNALLASGVVCGFLWEFWNWHAAARWRYVFPVLQSVRIFEMPLPGYLGFPAFAAEVFAMYVYATWRLGLPFYEVK